MLFIKLFLIKAYLPTIYSFGFSKLCPFITRTGLPLWLRGIESACNAGDLGSIPGLGRSPGGGHGNGLQCSRLDNPINTGAWQAVVHRVAQSQTRLKWISRTSSITRTVAVLCDRKKKKNLVFMLNKVKIMVVAWWVMWKERCWGSCFSSDVKWRESHLVVSDSLWPPELYVAGQVPLSVEFSEQEDWNWLPIPLAERPRIPRTCISRIHRRPVFLLSFVCKGHGVMAVKSTPALYKE